MIEAAGKYWFVLDVNPEPWAIGDLSVGRRNGKLFPMVGRNHQLHDYKMAVKSEIGNVPLFYENVSVELRFWFWRQIEEYTTAQGRAARSHHADLTNLQKATEDALQGIIMKNDKDTNDIQSILMEQNLETRGRVVFSICNYRPSRVLFPDLVQQKMDELDQPPEPFDTMQLDQGGIPF